MMMMVVMKVCNEGASDDTAVFVGKVGWLRVSWLLS